MYLYDHPVIEHVMFVFSFRLGMVKSGFRFGSRFSLSDSGFGYHFLVHGPKLKPDFFSCGSGSGSTQKNPDF